MKAKTPAYYKNKRATKKRRYSSNRIFLNSLKDKPCQLCHVRYPPWVMQFDHLDHLQKEFKIGAMVGHKSQAQLRRETEKCRVLCSNCHADVTHKNRRLYKERGSIQIDKQQELWN